MESQLHLHLHLSLWLLIVILHTTTHCAAERDVCDVIPSCDVTAAQIIWNYMLMKHTLHKCDVIIALGSYDVRVARRAADLWLEGFGDWLILSGNTGNLTQNLWTLSEAEVFCDVAVGRGVPRERILLEKASTNTGQNVQKTHALLSRLGISPSSFLLVQKPYMERRAFATFLAQWPGIDTQSRTLDVVVTSPDVTLLEYPNDDVGSLTDVISVMLGDMQRIFLYGELGFQVKQEVPDTVVRAFNYLKNTETYGGYLQ